MNIEQSLGKVKVLTGGIAREPFGMIWCDSGADSIVWMGKDKLCDAWAFYLLCI